MRILTRAEALALGLRRYFTGKPCKHGHVTERSVGDWTCVECSRLESRDPSLRERRRGYFAEHQRRYRKKHPDRVRVTKLKHGQEHLNAQRKARRIKDPSKDRAALQRSYFKHREKRLAETKAWKLANPEKAKALQKAGKANRRALEKAATGKITKQDVLNLFVLQFGFCAADDCRADLSSGYHLDHIIPLSRRGSNDLKNAQLLCEPCNLSKHNKTMEEWMAWKASVTSSSAPVAAVAQQARRSC